ncbi:MAG: recombination regulator RecX [Gemmatimonadota bacterium]|nr:recombination regulator RecX [Gemmatimonadota bacterium]
MPLITDLTPDARRAGRVDVAVDGRTIATLTLDAAERLDLHRGRDLSEAELLALTEEATALGTYDRAQNMLASRARSARDLKRQLVRKGEPERFVDRAIERLITLGFLDDAEYARQFARIKSIGSGFSVRRLHSELARRGVARDVADAAIKDVTSDESLDESAALERIARKQLHLLRSADESTRRRRLYSFLARRGYSSDDIRKVMTRLLSTSDEEERDSAQ